MGSSRVSFCLGLDLAIEAHHIAGLPFCAHLAFVILARSWALPCPHHFFRSRAVVGCSLQTRLRAPRSYAFPDALDHPLATAALCTPPERDAPLDATRLRTPPDYASACATGHLATATDHVRSLSTAILPLGHLDSEGTRQPFNPRRPWPRRHKQRAPATFLLWDLSLFCLTGFTGEGIRQSYSPRRCLFFS